MSNEIIDAVRERLWKRQEDMRRYAEAQQGRSYAVSYNDLDLTLALRAIDRLWTELESKVHASAPSAKAGHCGNGSPTRGEKDCPEARTGQ